MGPLFFAGSTGGTADAPERQFKLCLKIFRSFSLSALVADMKFVYHKKIAE